MVRLLIIAVRVLGVLLAPIYFLVRLLEIISGHDRWCRRHIQAMTQDRPALADETLVRDLELSPEDACVWLTLRQQVAAQCGLPATAIYPEDSLAILNNLTLCGLDEAALFWCIEKQRGTPLTPSETAAIDQRYREAGWRKELDQFGHLAAVIANGLQDARAAEHSEPTEHDDEPSPAAPLAMVAITRLADGLSFLPLEVFIDGQLVGRVRRRRTEEFSLPAGEHEIAVTLGLDVRWSASLHIQLAAGERVELCCWSNQPALHPWHVYAAGFFIFLAAFSHLKSLWPAIGVLEPFLTTELFIALVLGALGLILFFRKAYRAGAFRKTEVFLSLTSEVPADT
jgi:hypothetical protein